jgi:hypothetical protein
MFINQTLRFATFLAPNMLPVYDSDYDAIRQIAATAAAVRPSLADFS